MPSIQIRCYLGQFKTRFDWSASRLALDGVPPEEYIRLGSIWPDGASPPDVELVIDTSRFDRLLVPAGETPRTGPVALNNALRELITEGDDPDPPDTIGLLLADQWDPMPSVFGVMFDPGFDLGDIIEGDSQARVPRQGAAIFVDTIRQDRSPEQVNAQVMFDAVHELGHVFNLWHTIDPADLSFLTQSLPDRVFTKKEGAFRFINAQRRFLALYSTSPFVAPGGAVFGTRGGLGPEGVDLGIQDEGPATGKLSLQIAMSQPEFFPFEPVELEVVLRSSSRRTMLLPHELDPGYDRFKITILGPDGVAKPYRPPLHFCRNMRRLRLEPAGEFRRDISIFGQSGGYTFTTPGTYHLHASFQLGHGKILRSNDISINVLAPRPKDPRYRDLAHVLASPRVARMLYYRAGPVHSATLRQLDDFNQKFRGTPAASGVQYAVARTLLTEHQRKSGAPRHAKELRRRAVQILKRVANHQHLSPHRREVAERLIG